MKCSIIKESINYLHLYVIIYKSTERKSCHVATIQYYLLYKYKKRFMWAPSRHPAVAHVYTLLNYDLTKLTDNQ